MKQYKSSQAEACKSSHVTFNPCDCLINPDYHHMTCSEMIKQVRKTGQLPYSSMRRVVDTSTEDIDSYDFDKCTDKMERVILAEELKSQIDSLEFKKNSQQKELEDSLRADAASASSPSSPAAE